MINVNEITKISDLLSYVFFYGFSHNYSDITIEERILDSVYFNELENGDASFLIRETTESTVGSIYRITINDNELVATNAISLWLGEIYTRLFFAFNKSFSFIFLYLPISSGIDLFPLYHEMDFYQTMNHFASLIEEKSVLKLLLKKKKMTARELSNLSGINYNTIVDFTRNNEYIYNARFESIFRITQILKVNINVFSRSIDNYVNSDMYNFDKNNLKYRSYLGLFIASYYHSSLEKRKYVYDNEKNLFVFNEFTVKTLFTSISDDCGSTYTKNHEIYELLEVYSKTITPNDKRKQIVIIFEYNEISESVKPYLPLLKYGFEKIFIINTNNILCISDDYWIGFITDSIKNAMVNKAKRESGGEFAI